MRPDLAGALFAGFAGLILAGASEAGSSAGAVLLDPALDVALAPDPTGGELADRPGEGGGPGELVGSLLADAQEGGDLGDTQEIHTPDLTRPPLTSSSPNDTLVLTESIGDDVQPELREAKEWCDEHAR